MQRYRVVIPREDGGVEVHPLKEWLRQNPDHIPNGLDPTTSTSHQLRNALRRAGWQVQMTPSEVRLIKSSMSDSGSVVETVLGEGAAVDAATDEEELAEAAFSLEYQLRDFIAANLGSIPIGGRRLQLYVNEGGRDGIEYPSAVGPIDILAQDENGAYFVFELKRGNSPDRALGQLARYMGWVRQTLGAGSDVFGVIVAKSISDNLRYGADVMPNVSLFEYEIDFRLRAADNLNVG
jgi:hypothetical protein